MERATAPKKLNVPLTLSTVVAIAAAYLAAAKFPHSIPLDAPRPVAAARLAGRWAVNDELGRTGTFLARDKLVGAETVFLDRAASCDVVYATDSRGRVWEVDARDDGGEPRLLTHVGGTLLGAAFDDHGDLYVADSTRGLIRVPAEAVGHAHTHANSAMIVSSMAPSHLSAAATDQALAESEIRYADDVAVAGDTGFIYFTDATKVAPIVGTDRRGDTFRSWATSHLSGEASGRVLCYVPDTGETIVVATGLRFANGIGVSRDGSHLIVAATSSYKLVRMPTLPAGVTLETAPPPKTAQELQDFHDGPLPGFPDGVSVSRATGHVWTTVFVPVPPVARLGDIAPRWVRSILVRLPHELRPKPRTHSMFAEFFPNGTLVGAYHDRTKQFALLSSVEHCDGPHLFAGALNQKYIARFDLGA